MCGDSSMAEQHINQCEDGGSNPTSPLHKSYKNSGLKKSPEVKSIDKKKANEMLNRWHYLGAVIGILFAYGHEEGVLVFTNCRSRVYEQKCRKRGIKVIELARMVGKDGHEWSMSSLTSKSIKKLKAETDYDLVVTYSDPFAGHDGMTYKASGWGFDGETSKEKVFLIDKKRIARRTLYDRHGTQSVKVIKGIYKSRLEIKAGLKKKRFIKVLNKKTKTKLITIFNKG
jgi:hypothetical protein